MKDTGMLTDMFRKQELLMERYSENDKSFPAWPIDITNKTHQKFVRDILVNCAAEVFESTRELRNHKQHRQTEIIEFDRAKFLEEIIDAQHFLLEACIMIGIDVEEFFEGYVQKNLVCNQRIDNGY